MTPEDESYLRRAIGIATKAREAGERPFGSLLVGPGGVLAEDHTPPTANATSPPTRS
ncbi:MAG: hypothetical protein ACRDTM_12000 [Micromonosporaceae bacterium]